MISDENGHPLQAPLNLTADVVWVGYANAALRERIDPLLRRAMQHHQLIFQSERR
jgi:hypothetical protein